jgi:hypothetical protein
MTSKPSYLNAAGRQGYARFLTPPMPRAFVIAPDGARAFSALGFDPQQKRSRIAVRITRAAKCMLSTIKWYGKANSKISALIWAYQGPKEAPCARIGRLSLALKPANRAVVSRKVSRDFDVIRPVSDPLPDRFLSIFQIFSARSLPVQSIQRHAFPREMDGNKKGRKSAEGKIFSPLLYQLSYLALNHL